MPAYRAIGYEVPGQSVFIATPAYESVKAGYALSLARTVEELTRRGIPRTINILFGNCHVDDGRNELVRDFLDNTKCTDLVFIDADVMWEPEMLLRLLRHDVNDIVAGAYPYKSNNGRFPVGKILGGIEGGKGKAALLSVSYAPTGFMRIPRSVFEKLAPGGVTKGKLARSRRFFERRYTDNTYDGGDVTFCRKWIAEGGTVYVDPSLTLSHIGEHRWSGNFLDYMKKPENAELHTTSAKDPVPEYRPDVTPVVAEFLEKASPTLEDFVTLTSAYGNKPFAATADFLHVMWLMAKALPEGSTILECGCGLSTVVLASTGHRVVALEEHESWAKRTFDLLRESGLHADIKVSPINGDWYDVKTLFAGLDAAFLVVDGPKRRDGVGRLWPVQHGAENGMIRADAAVIMDDIVSVNQVPGEWIQNKRTNGERPFVAGRLRELGSEVLQAAE